MEVLEEAYEQRNKKLNKIEKIKESKAPISVYKRLQEISSEGLDTLKD